MGPPNFGISLIPVQVAYVAYSTVAADCLKEEGGWRVEREEGQNTSRCNDGRLLVGYDVRERTVCRISTQVHVQRNLSSFLIWSFLARMANRTLCSSSSKQD
jgi:hypothetical protein